MIMTIKYIMERQHLTEMMIQKNEIIYTIDSYDYYYLHVYDNNFNELFHIELDSSEISDYCLYIINGDIVLMGHVNDEVFFYINIKTLKEIDNIYITKDL